MLLKTFVASLLLSAAAVQARRTTELNCYTEMGTKSVKGRIQTSTKAAVRTVYMLPSIVRSTKTKTITITDPATTETITSTVEETITTTDTTVTDTFSTTSTETVTETDTASTTVTETQTETSFITTTSTPVIAAPSGFLNIRDTRNQINAKREIAHPHYVERGNKKPPKGGCLIDEYPQRVQCKKTVKVRETKTIVVPGRPSTATVTPAPVTVTETSTTTSTSTVVPDNVSTTLSFSTTETATETTTTTITEEITATSTTIITVAAPTPFYEACGERNMLGPRTDEGHIYDTYNTGRYSGTIYDYILTTSAYDCCVACMNKADCTAAMLIGTSSCLLLHNAQRTCTSQTANPAFYLWSSQPYRTIVLSNGPCGYVYNGGSI